MLAALVLAALPNYQETRPARERTPVHAEWESLGYGMFIHFGLATFTQDELGRKDSPASAYAPTALDVDQWCRVARDAGMKYAVLTAKHCCGHCLWDSAYTDYDVANSTNKVDVLAEFTKACKKYKIKPGFYYLLGWEQRHQRKLGPERYEEFCRAQITELLTKYGPITELWLDIPGDLGADAKGALQRIYSRAKVLQPSCLVMLNQGFRNGESFGTARPSFYWKEVPGAAEFPVFPTDLLNGERTLPPASGHDPKKTLGGESYYIPMEVCDTIAQQWFHEPGDPLRSVRSLLREYQECRARRANFLLDVPPDTTGRIPEATVARLIELRAAIDDPKLVASSVSEGKKTTASNVYHDDATWGPDKATDGDSRTRWATDDAIRDGWLQVDLGDGASFDGCHLSEAYSRIRKFEIQIQTDAGAWQTIAEGTTIPAAGIDLRFAKVTAKLARIRILEATGGPTLWDFDLTVGP